MAGLRALAWRGGLTMAARQVTGMVVSFAGLVALARLIGPAAYGVYVSAFALHAAVSLLLQWGVDVYLIRKPTPPEPEEIDQAFTLLLIAGAAGAALAWPAGWLAEAWVGIDGIHVAVGTLFAGMPMQLVAAVPSGLLQRDMAYGKVAAAELAGQVALYGGGVAAALAGLGLEAPLLGWALQQAVMTPLFFVLARCRPRLAWQPDLLRPMVAFGAGYASSVGAWHLRGLVNPLVVARLLGPEAAAAVAVALRLVEALAFMKTVLWRVAMPALGRLQSDPARLSAGVAEGVRLQVLAVGPALAVFALLAPWLVPFAFGKDWGAVARVFPYLAVAGLVGAAFSLHSVVLALLGRNGDVAVFHLVNALLLAAAAAVAVPRLGLAGYCLAEGAALSSYGLLHARAVAAIGPVDVGLGLVWVVAFALPLFADLLGPAAWVGPPAVLLLPATRRALAGWWSQIKELAHG
ncbi:MAG TPA: oligosaccharide flippase family protein [Candidatus Omnitrophota bacterium]|nr:oligosaccharide flippase family protein [Candidatus Omnitrophota bacterium]